jgi:hypothetical protein
MSCLLCPQLLLTVCAGHVTIDMLPDNVLLHIFRFESFDALSDRLRLQSWWYRLVRVCRRWRSVILAWPNFLDLKLVYAPWTHVRHLAIWPTLPIIVTNIFLLYPGGYSELEYHDFDIATVHRNHNRICEMDLLIVNTQLQGLTSAMQEQFPALRHLKLRSLNKYTFPTPALPDGFSAPRLQSLDLDSIPFPALPKLLSSATDLVDLRLWNIYESSYISPQEMVTSLSVLVNLKSLAIEVKFLPSLPDREHRHSLLPTLPALTHFEFQGASEYIDDLVVRIDTPLLDSIRITFSDHYDSPQFAEFIRRTTRFQTLNLNEAHVDFGFRGILVYSLPPTDSSEEKSESTLRIACEDDGWNPSSLARFLTSLFPSIYIVEHLYVYGDGLSLVQSESENTIRDMQWPEIFHPFTAVKKLYIRKEFAGYIAPALQQLVGERATHVLPALESPFLGGRQPSGSVQEAFDKFIAARQLSGHPVAVSHWDRGQEILLRRF